MTGVGYSSDGGRTFTDLIGLANNNPFQQWYGDPSVVAVDANTFIIAGLYYPSLAADCTKAPQLLEAAVEVATVGANNQVSFSEPVVVASGGDYCGLINNPDNPPPNLAQPDKEWLAYDPATRTVAVSYTRFFLGGGGQSGNGQVELVRAHLPAQPSALSSADFTGPTVVWPEEPTAGRVVFVWNDASLHPLGDIFLRTLDMSLASPTAIAKVNDDSSYACTSCPIDWLAP